MFFSLSMVWICTEFMERHSREKQFSVNAALRNIDTPSILFFAGILLMVAALNHSGILQFWAQQLQQYIHSDFSISAIFGSACCGSPGHVFAYSILLQSSLLANTYPGYRNWRQYSYHWLSCGRGGHGARSYWIWMVFKTHKYFSTYGICCRITGTLYYAFLNDQ